jgi:hypothetical protein
LKSTELLGAKGKQESDERLKNHTELIRWNRLKHVAAQICELIKH